MELDVGTTSWSGNFWPEGFIGNAQASAAEVLKGWKWVAEMTVEWQQSLTTYKWLAKGERGRLWLDTEENESGNCLDLGLPDWTFTKLHSFKYWQHLIALSRLHGHKLYISDSSHKFNMENSCPCTQILQITHFKTKHIHWFLGCQPRRRNKWALMCLLDLFMGKQEHKEERIFTS